MTGESSRWSGVVKDAGVVFALCSFAIAQPLFGLLGDNPTFFVAHDVEGGVLVGFALALLLVPPIALFGLLVMARLISPTVARVARALLVGILLAVTLLPPLERALGLSRAAWLVAGVILAGVASLAYNRFAALRTFVVFLTPAPVLFVVLFLFVSPVKVLVTGSDPVAADKVRGRQPPIVVVIFDELPLGALLDDQGRIDATRYPGFARLAGTSTWYDQTTANALYTHMAVPAIVSGQLPEQVPVPVAANYPHSLFTFLARSHHFHPFETLTRLCPEEFCHHVAAQAPDLDFASDLETVYLHTLLGDELAENWGVAPINDRWSGFGTKTTNAPLPTAPDDPGLDMEAQVRILTKQDKLGVFETFLASLGKGKAPGLWFIHSLLPHQPYKLLPNGLQYSGEEITGLSTVELMWSDELNLVKVGAQRMVLQTKVVDELVGRMLDRLDATGLLDEAIVVVTADHGAVFETGEHFRALSEPGVTERNKNEILPVPLFVKYPGQTTGQIDSRSARSIDVLPTIIDALGADIPDGWDFDGRSLLGKQRGTRPYLVVEDGEHDADTVEGPVNGRVMQRKLQRYLGASGDPHDGFRVGPFGNLVGVDPAPIIDGSTIGRVQADNWSAYDNVDFDQIIPALFEATVTGVDPGSWVAVALNGTIAGVGPVYRHPDGNRIVAMLDPALMLAGANRVDVYEIGGFGTTLRPLDAQR